MSKDGVKALICDSTNVFSPKPGRSEASVGPEITKLVQAASGMVVATTFASNVARVKTLAEAGAKAGRSIVLMGRAMRRMVEAAVETGVLKDFPKVVKPEDAAAIPAREPDAAGHRVAGRAARGLGATGAGQVPGDGD